MMYINDTSVHNNVIIDDVYKLYIVENVTGYKLIDYNTHVIDISTNSISGAPNYYFVIDFPYDDAFGHWVFESAIYLPIFNKLKESYSNIKLLLKSRKQYKKIFINFFNINESDVVYDNAIGSNNICLFPSPISSLNDKSLPENFKIITQKFVSMFHSFSVTIPNTYDYVVLPRQIKENYQPCDRKYDFSFVYNALNEKKLNYFILNTDDITNLIDQIQTVRSSSNIVVCDASAFIVNNMFCLNSDIHIVATSPPTEVNGKEYPKLNYAIVVATQINNNKLHYIYDNILQIE